MYTDNRGDEASRPCEETTVFVRVVGVLGGVRLAYRGSWKVSFYTGHPPPVSRCERNCLGDGGSLGTRVRRGRGGALAAAAGEDGAESVGVENLGALLL